MHERVGAKMISGQESLLQSRIVPSAKQGDGWGLRTPDAFPYDKGGPQKGAAAKQQRP